MIYWNYLAFFSVLVAVAYLSEKRVEAQMFGYGADSGSSAKANLVEEDRALADAKDSFHHVVKDEVQASCRKVEGICPKLEKAAEDIQTDFYEATEDCINRLKGDGVLDAEELSDKLGELRDDFLSELEEALYAIRKGHPPPPVARNFPNTTNFTIELTRYTFLQRNTFLDWFFLTGAILSALIVAKVIKHLISHSARRLNESRHPWSVQLLSSLRGPLYVTAFSLSIYIGLTWLWIPGVAQDLITQTIQIILTLAIFWFLWNVSRSIGSAIAWTIEKTYDREVDQHVAVIIRRIIRIVVVLIFFLVVIHVILDSSLTGLLAGFGIIGLALSFILKGTLENVMASFTIFADKPFRVGDMIIYDDEWGTVEDVGFRSTKFRTLDGHLYSIPNVKLIDDSIRNVGARPYVRRRFHIGLTFGTPPDKVREAIDILHDILDNHEGQPDDSPAHIEFESYGVHELRILVQYYYEPPDYWKALALDTKVNLEILKRFKEAAIEIAFPTETHILSTDDDKAPEISLVDSKNSKKESKKNSKEEKEVSAPSQNHRSNSQDGSFEEQNQENGESGND